MADVYALAFVMPPLTEGGETRFKVLDSDFDPQILGYVDRCKLWAELQALADIVDPGEYRTWQMEQQMTRSIVTSEGDE